MVRRSFAAAAVVGSDGPAGDELAEEESDCAHRGTSAVASDFVRRDGAVKANGIAHRGRSDGVVASGWDYAHDDVLAMASAPTFQSTLR